MADLKDAFSSTARVFWLYQGFAVAAALLAFLPDKSTTYEEAIDELRRLNAIHIRIDNVENAIRPSAFEAAGKEITATIRETTAQQHITMSPSVTETSSYFLIETGPQSLSFDQAPVSQIIDAITTYRDNPTYTIAVPDAVTVRTALQQRLVSHTGSVTRFDLPCNYSENRCRATIYIDPDGDEIGAEEMIEFYAPRKLIALPYGVRDLIEGSYPSLKGQWDDVSALQRMKDDIAELKPAEAIAKLQEMLKADDRPLSVLDVTFSGATARLIAPLVLALLAFAAWVSATGLAALKPKSAEVARSLFLPLISTRPAVFTRVATLIFPLAVTEGFLLRGWRGGLISFVLAICALGVQSFAAIALYNEFSKLRTLATRTRNRPINPVLAGLLVGGIAMGCVAWSLFTATKTHSAAAPISEVLGSSRATTASQSSQNVPEAEKETMERAINDIRRQEEGGDNEN